MRRQMNGALLALGSAVLLCGCAGFRIHDEARSKIATDTRQAYTDAKITEVPKTDSKNLETMLVAELDVLREASRNELDIALLKIANNTTPMGYTFLEAMKRLNELGFETIADLRKISKTQAEISGEMRKLNTERQALEGKGQNAWGIDAPECDDQIPVIVPAPKNMADDKKKDLQRDYDEYLKVCRKLLGLQDLKLKGGIGAAFNDWRAAKSEFDKAVALQKAEEAKVKAAKQAYDDAIKARAESEKKGPEFEKAIADKAKELASAVESAKKIDKGVEHGPFIDSLVDLLTATAGGNVAPKDPDLQGAMAVAKQIPSLAGDIAEFEAMGTAPQVSGLLIALRHQTLQADSAKKRAALEAERVEILKTKYDIYRKAAEKWLLYFDATCNYAVVGAGQGYPGENCNDFIVVKQIRNVEETAKDDDGKEFKTTKHVEAVSCELQGQELRSCLLNRTWKAQLRGHQNEPILKRELYESVAAYLQAITLQARPLEQSMREIDVRHRQTLVAKQTAIEQWDNLVGVPLEQLDAYYKAGVKPAELADLIVKALGFTAIAIGVSQ